MSRRVSPAIVLALLLSLLVMAPATAATARPSEAPRAMGVCDGTPMTKDQVRGVVPEHPNVKDDLHDWGPNGGAICDATWVPGHDPAGTDNYSYFVPQGLALINDNLALVSGYNDFIYGEGEDEDNVCEIHTVNLAAGVGEDQVEASAYLPTGCGHAGGIAIDSSDNIWVSDTHTLYRLDNTLAVVQTIELKGELSGSFLTEDGSTLWLGRWEKDTVGAMYQYGIDQLIDVGNGELTNDTSIATRVIPAGVQGATLDLNGEMWTSMSTSTWGRIGTPNSWGDQCMRFGPGSEEITFDSQGRLVSVFEAGTRKYGDEFFPVIASFYPYSLFDTVPSDDPHNCDDRGDCSAGSPSAGLTNMGFEDPGLAPWKLIEVTDAVDVTGPDAFTGTWEGARMASLGRPRGSASEYQPPGPNEICQEFVVPLEDPVVEFAYNVFTYDYTGYDDFQFDMEVVDPNTGDVLVASQQGAWATGTDLKTTGWRGIQLNLGGHIGETVQLRFSAGGTYDDLYGFWVYLDSASATHLPPEPIVLSAVETASGSVMTDPTTGEVTIAQPYADPSAISINTTVNCPDESIPSSVTLLLDGFGYPMTQTAPPSPAWAATIPEGSVSAGTLSLQAACASGPVIINLGKIVLYDPSGYLTDALTGDPVVGAEVTLYNVPGWTPATDPSDTGPTVCESNLSKPAEDPWSQPAPTAEGVVANPYSGMISPTVNPFISNVDGYYGWDVAEGCWYVVVEADGYETVTSPVVGVPTEVTDLNLTMMPDDLPSFLDVDEDHPFYSDIMWMALTGITTGYSDNTYRPAAAVTRQSMAAFLYRLAGSPDGDDPSCAAAEFPDVPASHPFCGEIRWMVDAGVTTGFTDGTFRPGASVTRQAMSAFMHRYADSVM
jgi:hypothetical protein